MDDIAIRVENPCPACPACPERSRGKRSRRKRSRRTSKQYRIGSEQERYRTLRDTLTDVVTAPFRRICSTFQRSNDGYIWALKDVSFEVKRGEVVGAIGLRIVGHQEDKR